MELPKTKLSRARFLRGLVFAVVALIGSVVASFGQLHPEPGDAEVTFTERTMVYAGAGLLLVAGVLAAHALGGSVQAKVERDAGPARPLPLGKIVTIAGYVLVLLWTLGAVGVPLDALLLGGALTGIVFGIAAQQTLGNIFAGIVLLLVRPFAIGERAIVKSSLGEYEGTVTDMGLFYVSMDTDRGLVQLPNAVALGSAVGPGAGAPKE